MHRTIALGRHTLPVKAVLVLSVLFTLAMTSRAALAQEGSRPGVRGTLAIDTISGFRATAISAGGTTGFAYAGPIGFMHQNYSEDPYNAQGTQTTVSTNTFWLAPSADFFVIDGLSVGGLIEVNSTSGSVEQKDNIGRTVSVDLPTTTNFTLLPRVGYLFALSDKWGIWPRGGIGYASRQGVTEAGTTGQVKTTSSGVLTDIDVGFIWRPIAPVFFRLGPEVSFTLGASHSQTNPNGVSVSANSGLFAFGILGGVGAMFEL